MFGRDKGFGVPVVAVTADGAEGIEKRAEVFVGESNSAEEDERTEKRDGGGCADMTVTEIVPNRTEVADRHHSFYQHYKSRGQSTTRSLFSSSPMNSPVVSPRPRPAEFQAHVYNSFLQGTTSDVAIRIRGSWDAIYKFHRVVLIQAVHKMFSCSNALFTYAPSRITSAIFSQEGL